MGDLRRKLIARKGKADYHVEVGRQTAMIVVIEDLPDEARLALLVFDVTAEELRGKTLRWDPAATAWHADDEG